MPIITNERSHLLKQPRRQYSSAWKIQDSLAYTSYLPQEEEVDDTDEQNTSSGSPGTGTHTRANKSRSLRRRLFLLLTEPESSIASAVIFVVLIVMISLSVVIMVIQTIPMYQFTPTECKLCGGNVMTGDDDDGDVFAMNDDSVSCQCPPKPLKWTIDTQDILMYIFTVEWILRAICFVPSSSEIQPGLGAKFCQWLSFLTEWGQVIDALAIFPYYLEQLNKSNSFLPLRLLRFTRVFRILRLGQYNDTFSSLLNVLYESSSSLNLLLIVVAFGACFFGSLMYFVERGKWVYTDLTDPPSFQYVRVGPTGNMQVSPFRSIPDCFWWFIVTATTVGYGDTYPTSAEGKIIASLAMLMGVLVIAFPVSIFSDFWGIELERRGKLSSSVSGLSLSRSNLSSSGVSLSKMHQPFSGASLYPFIENSNEAGSNIPDTSIDNANDIIHLMADSDGTVKLRQTDLIEICNHIEGINRSQRRIKSILKSYADLRNQTQTPSEINGVVV